MLSLQAGLGGRIIRQESGPVLQKTLSSIRVEEPEMRSIRIAAVAVGLALAVPFVVVSTLGNRAGSGTAVVRADGVSPVSMTWDGTGQR
jgi:hypothetical protein